MDTAEADQIDRCQSGESGASSFDGFVAERGRQDPPRQDPLHEPPRFRIRRTLAYERHPQAERDAESFSRKAEAARRDERARVRRWSMASSEELAAECMRNLCTPKIFSGNPHPEMKRIRQLPSLSSTSGDHLRRRNSHEGTTSVEHTPSESLSATPRDAMPPPHPKSILRLSSAAAAPGRNRPATASSLSDFREFEKLRISRSVPEPPVREARTRPSFVSARFGDPAEWTKRTSRLSLQPEGGSVQPQVRHRRASLPDYRAFEPVRCSW